MKVIEVNESNFQNEVLNGKVLVDFNATWCGPCRMLKPIIEDFAKDSKTKIVSVDTDSPAVQYALIDVLLYPSFILFHV